MKEELLHHSNKNHTPYDSSLNFIILPHKMDVLKTLTIAITTCLRNEAIMGVSNLRKNMQSLNSRNEEYLRNARRPHLYIGACPELLKKFPVIAATHEKHKTG